MIPQTISNIYIWYLCIATYRLSPPMNQMKNDDFFSCNWRITGHWCGFFCHRLKAVFFAKLTHSWWLNLKKMMPMWNVWAQRAWELLLVTEAGGGWASPQPPPSPHTRDHSWTPSQSRSLVTCVYTNTQTHNQTNTQIWIENMKIYTKSSPLHWRLGTWTWLLSEAELKKQKYNTDVNTASWASSSYHSLTPFYSHKI